MGIREWFAKPVQEAAGVTLAPGEYETIMHRLENATESMVQLQMAAEDQGWQKLGAELSGEFTREGLKRNAQNARLMAIANPLIKRGLAIRHAYVWGQGVQVSARDDSVNDVVQAFLDDEGTREVFSGAQARERWSKATGTDGNRFFVCFTNPLDGRIRIRTLPFDEIQEIVTAPGDKATPHYYLRVWTETVATQTFGTTDREMKAYYPALKYQPLTKPKNLGGIPVYWDAPVYHEKVNGLDDWKWGIGDSYASLNWARAYKEFLEDWALLMKALSKIAYTASKKGVPDSQKARGAIANMGALPAGSTAVMSEHHTLEAMPKSGATLDSESGRPLAAMVAAGLGVSVIDLLADPGQVGSRATAQTMDLPKRLEMRARQEVHTETMQAVIGYVIEQAIIAPRGPLNGKVVRDGDRLTAALNGDAETTVEVVWPALDETPLDTLMKAIVDADGTNVLPKVEILKLILHALDVKDADEIVEKLTDDDGNFIDPTVNAGTAATDRFRAGQQTESFAG